MDAPTLAEEGGDGDAPTPADEDGTDPVDEAEEVAREAANESAPEPDGEPNVEEVELSDDDLGGNSADDLFTGEDKATTTTSDDGGDSDDSEDGDDGDDDALDALGKRGEGMEEAINDSAARLAVVGLEGDEKDDLQDEFNEVFQAFRLGYFGSRFAEEYLFTDDDEEVDPTWGLLGAMLTCTAFIVWIRPDGEEMVGKARQAVENIAGGEL